MTNLFYVVLALVGILTLAVLLDIGTYQLAKRRASVGRCFYSDMSWVGGVLFMLLFVVVFPMLARN